jgi:hypothetical protein
MSPLQGCLHTPFPVPISYSDFAPGKHTNQHTLTFPGKRFPQPPCSASFNSLLPTMLTRHSVMTRRHLHCPLCDHVHGMQQNPSTNPDSWHRSVQVGVSVHNVMPVRGSVPSAVIIHRLSTTRAHHAQKRMLPTSASEICNPSSSLTA